MSGAMKFSCFLIGILSSISLVAAFPTGAGLCPEGTVAVSGPHLSSLSITTGTLEEGGIDFTIDGIPIGELDAPLIAGESYNWELTTSEDTPFRGFLIRLGGGDAALDTSDSIDSELDTVQIASTVCPEDVGGVTHVSNDEKTSIEGTLTVPDASANMKLDITVVVQNSDGISIYFYSGYTLDAVQEGIVAEGGAGNETASPSMAETLAETAAVSATNSEFNDAFGGPLLETADDPSPETVPPSQGFDELLGDVLDETVGAIVDMLDGNATESPTFDMTDAPGNETTLDLFGNDTGIPELDDIMTDAPTDEGMAGIAGGLANETAAPSQGFDELVGDVLEEVVGGIAEMLDGNMTEAPSMDDIDMSELDMTDLPFAFGNISEAPTMYGNGTDLNFGSDFTGNLSDGPLLSETDDQCSSESPCSLCQGDCNSDSDCEEGLSCYRRPGADESPVPGCSGIGVPGRDYCYDHGETTLYIRDQQCSPQNPCKNCEGDCDTDAECESGLVCKERDVTESGEVPGCVGTGVPGLDYCHIPSETGRTRQLLRKGSS